ncbi:MAG: hypothetical protein ABGW49_06270 [Nitrosopumilus sp.]|jgi:hypothetical protein
MGKSLGDYRIEFLSLSDPSNIQWSKKNTFDENDSKNKKTGKKSNISPTNILPSKSKKDQPVIEKVFKIEDDDTSKLKNTNTDKKFHNSSASNCNIKQGFKRPAR